jgi:hypothetical protein
MYIFQQVNIIWLSVVAFQHSVDAFLKINYGSSGLFLHCVSSAKKKMVEEEENKEGHIP